MELTDNQQRHLVSTFQYIDKLFSDAELVLSTTKSPSLFKQYVMDASPTQENDIERGIGEVRDLMRRVLESMGIPLEAPRIGAVRAVLSLLVFVDMALEELKAKHMRGYGELTEETSNELDRLVSEMQALIKRTNSLLSAESVTEPQKYSGVADKR